MKAYIGTKLINAQPMTRQAYNELRGWTVPADEDPEDEGYLVEYLDGGKPNTALYAGYVSWSPKEQFEKAYRETSGISFGLAVEALKAGRKVARTGWNGSSMFAFYVPEMIGPTTNPLLLSAFPDGMVKYRPYLALKTAQGDVATWAPSVSDSLADDWQIIE